MQLLIKLGAGVIIIIAANLALKRFCTKLSETDRCILLGFGLLFAYILMGLYDYFAHGFIPPHI